MAPLGRKGCCPTARSTGGRVSAGNSSGEQPPNSTPDGLVWEPPPSGVPCPGAATSSLSPNSCSCHHHVPTQRPGGKGGEPKQQHIQVFGGPEAPGEDGRIVVDGSELGQVSDLASCDPCRLSQNVPGDEQRPQVSVRTVHPSAWMGAGWSCHDTRGPVLPAHRPHGDRDHSGSTLSLRTLSNGAQSHHTWSLRRQRQAGPPGGAQ